MVNFHTIEMGHFAGTGFETHTFNGEVEIDKLEGRRLNKDVPDISVPGRVNALTMILTLAGRADIEIDGKEYALLPDTLTDITGLHIIRNFRFSDNYLGYNIMVSSLFYDDTFREEKHLTPEAALKRKRDPLDNIKPEETVLLMEIIERIIRNIGREDHIWQRRMIMNEVRNFYMEAGNIIINALSQAQKEKDRPDNDLLFIKFMQLLHNNSNERKSVAFYADKLYMSPDHFAKTIKAVTGRNVTDWINETLLRQAKLYLLKPEISVQQIAYMLKFSDQSAFGKFFKKQTGISPGKYRTG